MSEHRFSVYVNVNITERPDDERTEADIADCYLNSLGGTRQLENLDGFADMVGEVWMGGTEFEESQ